MTKELPFDSRELICINVDKVYDWILKEMSFDISPEGPFFFPGLPGGEDLTGATVSCEVSPAKHNPVVILSRENRPFNIDGETVYLQHLHLKKRFDVVLFLCLKNGTEYKSKRVHVSRCEQVTLCAPKGTEVEVTYTSLECFVCTTGMISHHQNSGYASPEMNGSPPVNGSWVDINKLTISVSTCQSIQSTFPVTVEFLADYCNPRADLPIACPGPVRPSDCNNIFPSS